jgi:hypothetical protein
MAPPLPWSERVIWPGVEGTQPNAGPNSASMIRLNRAHLQSTGTSSLPELNFQRGNPASRNPHLTLRPEVLPSGSGSFPPTDNPFPGGIFLAS